MLYPKAAEGANQALISNHRRDFSLFQFFIAGHWLLQQG